MLSLLIANTVSEMLLVSAAGAVTAKLKENPPPRSVRFCVTASVGFALPTGNRSETYAGLGKPHRCGVKTHAMPPESRATIGVHERIEVASRAAVCQTQQFPPKKHTINQIVYNIQENIADL